MLAALLTASCSTASPKAHRLAKSSPALTDEFPQTFDAVFAGEPVKAPQVAAADVKRIRQQQEAQLGQARGAADAEAASHRPASAPEPEVRATNPKRGVRPDSVLAVLEFRNRLRSADKESIDGQYFCNSVRSTVKRMVPALKVMTSENVLVLLRASGKSLADCKGDAGRRLGADLVISGDLVKVGSRIKLDMRIYETHEGQLLAGANAQGRDAEELDDAMKKAVQELLAPLN